MSTEIAKVEKDLLTPATMHKLEMVLARSMDIETFVQVVLASIKRTPQLLQCDRKSLYGAIWECARLRLVPDGVTGLAYILPFRNKGRMEAQLVVGYKGHMDLRWRSDWIQSFDARCVYSNDLFSYQYGTNAFLEHVPAEGDRGELRGCYAIAFVKNGGKVFEYWGAGKLEEHRNKFSKAPNSPAYKDHLEEMYKKCMILRIVDLLPISVDHRRAVSLDKMAEAGVSQGLAASFDENEPDPFDNTTESKTAGNLSSLKDELEDDVIEGEVDSSEPEHATEEDLRSYCETLTKNEIADKIAQEADVRGLTKEERDAVCLEHTGQKYMLQATKDKLIDLLVYYQYGGNS